MTRSESSTVLGVATGGSFTATMMICCRKKSQPRVRVDTTERLGRAGSTMVDSRAYRPPMSRIWNWNVTFSLPEHKHNALNSRAHFGEHTVGSGPEEEAHLGIGEVCILGQDGLAVQRRRLRAANDTAAE